MGKNRNHVNKEEQKLCKTNLFQAISAITLIGDGQVQFKLIPEFDGSPTGSSVVEWFKKVVCIYKVFRIKEPTLVILLRLTAGAYAVYQQLKKEANLDEIKYALYMAFGTDEFITWRGVIGRRLLPGETVRVYLTDLRKLSVPFGGISDQILDVHFWKGCLWMLAGSCEHHQSWVR